MQSGGLKVYQRKEKGCSENGILMEKEAKKRGCDSWFPNTPLKPITPLRTYFRKRSKKNLVTEELAQSVLAQLFSEEDGSFGNLELSPDLHRSLWGSEQVSGFGSKRFGELNIVNGESTQEPSDGTEITVFSATQVDQELFNSPNVAPSTPKLLANPSCQDHEQSQEKKEETNVLSFTANVESKFCAGNNIALDNLVSSMISIRSSVRNSKKRRENDLDLNKRPQKKPRKKIHRPKVVGEGKPKRTPKPKTPKRTTSKSASFEPCTPKPATPKRVISKKNTPGKRKNKNSLKGSITLLEEVSEERKDQRKDPIVPCRRSLNFDKKKNSEEQCIAQNEQRNDPLKAETSTQAVNKEADMSFGDFFLNQNGRQHGKKTGHQCGKNNSVKVYRTRLQTKRSNKHVVVNMDGWPIPSICKNKRSMRRKPHKGMHPKGKRSMRRPRKIFPLLKIPACEHLRVAGPQEKPACQRQECENFRRGEARDDALSIGGNDRTMIELQNELESFLGKLVFHKSVDEGSSLEEQNFQLDYNLSGYDERLIAEKPNVTGPSVYISEFQSGRSEVSPLKNQILSVTSNLRAELPFFNLKFDDGKSERSLLKHEDVLITTPPKSPCEGRNTLLKQDQFAQNPAQNRHGMVVPCQGSQGLDQGAVVPYGGLPEKAENENALVPQTENGTLVALQGELSIVKKSRKQVMLDLYSEDIKRWKLQLKDNSKVNDETEERLENERKVFHKRIGAFIARLHPIFGDRTFSAWKGSVVDSMVGVFLTQNVGDNLSSSAFMNLAAKFPLQSIKHNDQNKFGSQESFGSNTATAVAINHLAGPHLFSSESPEVMSKIEHAQLEAHKTTLVDPHSSLSNSFPISDCNFEAKAETNKRIAYDKPRSLVEETVQEGCMHPTDDDNSMLQKREEGKKTNPGGQQPGDTKMEARSKKNIEDEKKKENGIDWDEMRRKYCRSKEGKKKENEHDWDELRRKYCGYGQRHNDHKDSVDWEAVRQAEPGEIADAIRGRGQHNILALRIQELLDRVVKLHGNLDLEWLRHAPPVKVKKYLLEFHGLGLKSVECIRLLALQHVAFPVDTNVGRIAVRLGWVPLEPLPEELQIHLLQQFPVMDSIQKYLWPRLRTLDQRALYELHYHLITFGKVYCTKRNPNCNDCPMKGDCRHFASAYSSARRALPRPEKKGKVSSTASVVAINSNGFSTNIVPSSLLEDKLFSESEYLRRNCEPIIEEPASPEPERSESLERDIEDYFLEDDPDHIPTIRLSCGEYTTNLELCRHMKNMTLEDNEVSRALVAVTSEFASYPIPKLKSASRLRTKHLVYELPDSHPLLMGLDRRDPHDPCPYLLAIWTPGETSKSFQPSVCGSLQEENMETVLGTILVFADHESSQHPIDVPRSWIWNLCRRAAYFGTSTSTILKGLPTEEIMYCFLEGFLCVRAFDRKNGGPKPLAPRFHISTSQVGKPKAKAMANE
ncbi:DNA-3-methyladenine glycosylase I [Trema orientale]|uniref:DNA-3-methyladenine glycosylase I n=1 Tax=Trema orientale TaxID=63057 RepID=A0A2P5F734_TREOI|nr:DNA-3-methyladenine glycosylase I [Trema orientale]